jgi:AraC-like DNA-binding protein
MEMDFDFETFKNQYAEKYRFDLCLIDARGKRVRGGISELQCDCKGLSDDRRRQCAEQTRYWGETVIQLCCDNGFAMWSVPVTENNRLVGGLVVQGVDLEGQAPDFHEHVQTAANALLQLALDANLIHSAEIELARQHALREQDRFLAIEAGKKDVARDDIRTLYLMEEPDLLSAIKQGETGNARSILNRILAGIYGLSGDRMELLKSSVLELVVMMSRAAVEAGAEPAIVLGRNYRSLVELSRIDDEEDLADWVRRMLETLIDSIRTYHEYPHSLLLIKAVKHMQANLHQHLRRDDVARVAGLSPSHFSKIVTERMGRSFTQLLTQMRVNRAKELLLHTEKSLSEVAIECGFFDQSHFSKSFRSHTNLSPGEFRRRAN